MGSSPPPSELSRKPLDKHMLWAVVLVIGFIIASGIFMVWFGLRLLSSSVHVKIAGSQGRKVVTVKTPMGNFEVTRELNTSNLHLGLPVYPGARRTREVDDNNSVSLSFNLPDQASLRIAVAKFDTPDSVDRVREFYKKQLGGDVTSLTQTNRKGKTVFEIKYGEQDKVVTLRRHDGGTRIELVRIFHGSAEPN